MSAPVLPDLEYEAAVEAVRRRLVLPRIDLGTPLAPAGDTRGPAQPAPAELGQKKGQEVHR